MNKSKEALIDGLSYHFSPWYKFCVKFMQNIFQIISFDRLLRIEKFEEFLDKLWSNINLERSNFYCLIYYQLQEELINSLQMWPGWVNLILLFNTCF